jgi:hypothetical protein
MYKNVSTRIIFESVKSKEINSSCLSLKEGEREWVRNG